MADDSSPDDTVPTVPQAPARPEVPATTAPPVPPEPGKPAPDMAALMLELARIRREVDGRSEPRKPLAAKGWLMALAFAAALAWSVFGGTCHPPGGMP